VTTASTRPSSIPTPVFVDESGRRARWVKRAGAIVGLLALLYVGLVVAGLMGASVIGDVGVPHHQEVSKHVAETAREQQSATSTSQPALGAPTQGAARATQTTTATTAAAATPATTGTLPTTPSTAAHGNKPTSPPGQGRRP